MPSNVTECERRYENMREHKHGCQWERKWKRGHGHVGHRCRCRDTGLRLRHLHIRGRRHKVDRSRRSGPCQQRRRFRGRGVKLRTGRVGAWVEALARASANTGAGASATWNAQEASLARVGSVHAKAVARGRGRDTLERAGVAQKILEAVGCVVMVPDKGSRWA
ncbi:hypothetical protein SLEP1_g30899 [Rubroshorea leprosula]|uniref:Uncharacterized protein n=1 Tax=Rubroshorea leprosula TaxID=152421 RepID=A0AAV5K7Z1_9ROSI|nr:hypothetical protein SLEP1_g30899 [Rubroshorea leprosula]